MNGHSELRITGRIIHGTGEGKRFLSMPEYLDQFARILGCEPHPGTLNVRVIEGLELEKIVKLPQEKGIAINGFEKEGKHYLPGAAVPCRVRLGEHILRGVLYFPEKTVHPPNVLEVISCERILNFAETGEHIIIEI